MKFAVIECRLRANPWQQEPNRHCKRCRSETVTSGGAGWESRTGNGISVRTEPRVLEGQDGAARLAVLQTAMVGGRWLPVPVTGG